MAQLVYIDLRGNGGSDGYDDPKRWNLAQWTDDVKALWDVLEITRPIVVGYLSAASFQSRMLCGMPIIAGS